MDTAQNQSRVKEIIISHNSSLERLLRIKKLWLPYQDLNVQQQQIASDYIMGCPTFSRIDGIDNFIEESSIRYLGDPGAIRTLDRVFKNKNITSYVVVVSDNTWVYAFSDAMKIYVDLTKQEQTIDLLKELHIQIRYLMEKYEKTRNSKQWNQLCRSVNL